MQTGADARGSEPAGATSCCTWRSADGRLDRGERLEGPEARRSLWLEESHPVIKQITKAKWKLTQRGFGPWARIYRPAKAGQRQCVQLAILSWDALDSRAWPGVTELEPEEIARVLGVYAHRVITPAAPPPSRTWS